MLNELSKAPIGYLVTRPRFIEMLFSDGDVEFLAKNGIELFIPQAEELGPELRNSFRVQNIPVRGNYSCEEVGLIGCECEQCPGHYHVATSNVVIEVDRSLDVVGDETLGRIIITHLHSYATPFIRYDIGDLGKLSDVCSCGHDGPVLSNVLEEPGH